MTNENYADVIAHASYDFRGKREQVTYEIRGGAPLVFVSPKFLDDLNYKGGVLALGPYRLRRVETEDMFSCTFVREDYPLWRLVVMLYKATRIFDLAYRRFILTLAVWRLASFSAQTVPSLSDIYAVQWIKKKLGHD